VPFQPLPTRTPTGPDSGMWMRKRTSPWVTPVLSPGLAVPAPGAPGVGAGAGVAADPPRAGAEPPPAGAEPAALRAAGVEPEAAAEVAPPLLPPEALTVAGAPAALAVAPGVLLPDAGEAAAD